MVPAVELDPSCPPEHPNMHSESTAPIKTIVSFFIGIPSIPQIYVYRLYFIIERHGCKDSIATDVCPSGYLRYSIFLAAWYHTTFPPNSTVWPLSTVMMMSSYAGFQLSGESTRVFAVLYMRLTSASHPSSVTTAMEPFLALCLAKQR